MKKYFFSAFAFLCTQLAFGQLKTTAMPASTNEDTSRVHVSSFYIDESEVSNNEYKPDSASRRLLPESDYLYYLNDTTPADTAKPVIRGKLPWKNVDYYLSQNNDSILPSIHQEEAEKYAPYNLVTDAQWDSLRAAQGIEKKMIAHHTRACNLNKRVYGWHPYWSNGLQGNYDWSGLTDLCYFSYDVNSADGTATNTHGWSTASVITDAEAAGVNVTLCATLFSGHAAFFASSTAQQTLITNLINLVQARNGHGVNIDFEGMTASNSAGFTAFMINLCNQMHAAIPGSEVSIALYSVDWSSVFNMPALNPYVDLFIIMGYDYYYSGSTTAGPEDPLYNFQTSYNYTLTKSITYYLKQGASKSKLLLGLPYYGREWTTTSLTAPSPTTGSGSNTVIYNTFRNNANGYYSSRQWDMNSFSSWYPSTRGGVNWQAFINDASSMGKRFDIVNQYGIGGIGIWALGYDDGYNDLWNLIRNKFTSCAVVPCSDTIYDMGGPNRNYYDNENYTYTIAPSGASGVTLNFSSFATEPGYDTLWIYDGASAAAPLIGAYNGSTSPGTVTSSGSALTIRFKSDNATEAAGWQATWSCTTDHTAPATAVSAPAGWTTGSFSAGFTDTDNTGGSGIAKSYYSVSDFNGTEWRANSGNGFFNDNFDAVVHPDWTNGSGAWSINSGSLEQTDQANSNTNLYAALTQNLSNQYLYHFRGKIDGTGTNRRAGFHFFCDDASQTNRGNSYFVWFRVDQSVCEFYKVTSNVFSLMNSVPMTVNAGQWYDYKIVYDRTTGKMDVYQDNDLAGSWTDPSPLSNGNAVSFRSGNCDFMADDLEVFRSRYPAVTVSVGPAGSNDVRYQDPDPSTPSCRISSITKDMAGNLSPVVSESVNIDWTPPSEALVNDGLSADVDTSYSLTQLSANWSSCSDTNSAIAKYWYAIGTSPGATDIAGWTDNGMSTSATATGLALTNNTIYYFSVKSQDGAGLLSDSTGSDGQLVYDATGTGETSAAAAISIFPNPVTENATILYRLGTTAAVRILLTDIPGRQLLLLQEEQAGGQHSLQISKSGLRLAGGMYILSIQVNGTVKNYKLIVN